MVWQQFVGTLETLAVVEPGGQNTQLALPVDEPANRSTAVVPSLASLIPAPSTPEDDHRSPTVTYADVLPEQPGKEMLEFESGFNKPTVNGQWQKCVGRCLARRNGEWAQVWETEPLDELFQPLPLAGDFDGDRAPEVAVLPFHPAWKWGAAGHTAYRGQPRTGHCRLTQPRCATNARRSGCRRGTGRVSPS